jgi:hypothetical protein
MRHVQDESDAMMTQEIAVVILATAGPIVGSALGVWRKPTTAAIYNVFLHVRYCCRHAPRSAGLTDQ